jgi:hypothetical protein
MPIVRLLFAAALLLPLAATAQTLLDRYEVIGTAEADIDGRAMTLVVTTDREKNRSSAKQQDILGGNLVLNVLASTVGDAGKPASPRVQVTALVKGGAIRLDSVEVFDEGGYDAPLVLDAEEGFGALDDATLAFDGTTFTARIEGTMLRLTGYTSEPRAADGAVPVPARITLTTVIPPNP